MMIKVPTTVYKYQRWNYDELSKHLCFGKRIITNREIYFSSPLDFNDPFDGVFPIGLENIIRQAKSRNPNNQLEPVSLLSPESSIEKFLRTPSVIEGLQSKLGAVGMRVGIFCITTDCKNLLMWSHYADSHRGYCVGFDTAGLVKHLESKGYKNCYPRSAIYLKQFPEITLRPFSELTDDYILNFFRHKFEDWRYEDEYRLLSFGKSCSKQKLPAHIIKEIILGINMKPDDEDEILGIVSQWNHKPRILKAIREPDRYEITFAVRSN